MIEANGLSVITVKKGALVEALTANLAAHQAAYKEALEGFHKEVVDTLKKAVADAVEGKEFRTSFSDLVEPNDHTKDYERVIRMLTMSVSDEIKITESEFTCFVLDDWSWKRHFVQTSAMYAGKR